ncbi:BTB domain-containing protein [Phanerochaete sordida]|uniref:BTB domain-containing protein n=1 Tax=Phanerochaete sordida TaxID=48140 RepID=A0A9P3LGG6_9APHY|nr:BTB domain-containing protein [Phanerochaete sordida]
MASSSISREPVRDEEYYFEDDLTIFMVEDTLFKVHRHFLTRDSEFFRGLFECPVPPNEEEEGQSDANPIVLHGVTLHEFRCLLRFYYHGMYAPLDTLADWTALLAIATRFVFDRARTRAIAELGARLADPLEQVRLAHAHDVPAWLPLAYAALVRRAEPLCDAEAAALGLRTAVRVARARELARERRAVSVSQAPYYPFERTYACDDKAVAAVVGDVWPECAEAPPSPPPSHMSLAARVRIPVGALTGFAF